HSDLELNNPHFSMKKADTRFSMKRNWLLSWLGRHSRQVLLLGVRRAQEQEFRIYIDHFGYKQILRLVQQYAPSSALAKDAERNTESYRAWINKEAQFVKQVQLPLEVSDSWFMRGSGWFLILLVGLGAIVTEHVNAQKNGHAKRRKINRRRSSA